MGIVSIAITSAGRTLVFLVLSGTLVFAAPAAAANEAGTPFVQLPWATFSGGEPGTWVEYASLVGGYPVAPYLRVLLLGTEKVEGTEATWIEIWISQRPGSATQAFRLLVEGDPSRPGGIRKARVRLLGGRVQEVPPEDLMPTDPATGHDVAMVSRPRLDSETTSILTAAGSFESRLATLGRSGRDTKLWLSPAVPVFGLVRLEIAGRAGLELHAMGTGGRGVVEDAPAPATTKKATPVAPEQPAPGMPEKPAPIAPE